MYIALTIQPLIHSIRIGFFIIFLIAKGTRLLVITSFPITAILSWWIGYTVRAKNTIIYTGVWRLKIKSLIFVLGIYMFLNDLQINLYVSRFLIELQKSIIFIGKKQKLLLELEEQERKRELHAAKMRRYRLKKAFQIEEEKKLAEKKNRKPDFSDDILITDIKNIILSHNLKVEGKDFLALQKIFIEVIVNYSNNFNLLKQPYKIPMVVAPLIQGTTNKYFTGVEILFWYCSTRRTTVHFFFSTQYDFTIFLNKYSKK